MHQFIVTLLHIAAKKTVRVAPERSKEELLVLVQATSDLLSSYFDFTAYYPSHISGAIVVACQQVLLALKPKLEWSRKSGQQDNILYDSLASIALQVKALMAAHEHKLDSLYAFAPLARLCEAFLSSSSFSSPPSQPFSSSSLSLSFSAPTLQEIHSHFESLQQQVDLVKQQHLLYPQFNGDDPNNFADVDSELIYEIRRIYNT